MTKVVQTGDFALNRVDGVFGCHYEPVEVAAHKMREAAGDLAMMYVAEDRQSDADRVLKAFAELSDESAARLYNILRSA